jgi:hypothetical protein
MPYGHKPHVAVDIYKIIYFQIDQSILILHAPKDVLKEGSYDFRNIANCKLVTILKSVAYNFLQLA